MSSFGFEAFGWRLSELVVVAITRTCLSCWKEQIILFRTELYYHIVYLLSILMLTIYLCYGVAYTANMKIHLITIGEPKLAYAKQGWQEYLKRLQRFHQVRVSHLADKWADDASHILQAAGQGSYKVALVIDGPQFSSEELANFLEKRAQDGREACYIIGGPNGLPSEVISQADARWSFSKLTFPHDLAMVVLLESLYRASSINAGLPYHRA